jgi:uncharacterized protein with HEPN domain
MSDRDIRLFVADIIESIDAIEEFIKDCNYEDFVSDRKTYSATLREFIVIGEAILNIPDEMKKNFPEIEWRLIKDFRNVIVHEYFGIDNGIVWDAVMLELPILKKHIKVLGDLLATESTV